MKATTGGTAARVWLFAAATLLFSPALLQSAGTPGVDLDFSKAARARGQAIYTSICQGCHSLKYLGYDAKLSAEAARSAFGKVPPDLSLMAKARGKGSRGAEYIVALLTGYNDTPAKNSVFPNIAMPPPLPGNDPQSIQKARDVSAFLLYAADPSADERTRLGKYVLGYIAVLTALLYSVNRRVWRGIGKK